MLDLAHTSLLLRNTAFLRRRSYGGAGLGFLGAGPLLDSFWLGWKFGGSRSLLGLGAGPLLNSFWLGWQFAGSRSLLDLGAGPLLASRASC